METIRDILRKAERNGASDYEKARFLYLCAKKHIYLIENEYLLYRYNDLREQLLNYKYPVFFGWHFITAYNIHNTVLELYKEKHDSYDSHYKWCLNLGNRLLNKYLNTYYVHI